MFPLRRQLPPEDSSVAPVEEILEGKGKAAPRADPGGGYDPYDQGKVVKKPTKPKGPVGRRTR